MFPSGPDFTTPSPFPLHFLSSLLRLLLVLETPELLSSREASPDLVVLTSSIICIASQI
ncbi:BnaAnng16440D [Brassica napus]|uniref:BnaAnng16440D protein n=1 Tax=Brassica napus TaxID=3708 RepID=A0A078H325_BRANA|nr:BnaC08g15480D [Brassica napus]CDY60024.1 BnaAnng16440D [Brassica napus]